MWQEILQRPPSRLILTRPPHQLLQPRFRHRILWAGTIPTSPSILRARTRSPESPVVPLRYLSRLRVPGKLPQRAPQIAPAIVPVPLPQSALIRQRQPSPQLFLLPRTPTESLLFQLPVSRQLHYVTVAKPEAGRATI